MVSLLGPRFSILGATSSDTCIATAPRSRERSPIWIVRLPLILASSSSRGREVRERLADGSSSGALHDQARASVAVLVEGDDDALTAVLEHQ